jgi:hypothetical protein
VLALISILRTLLEERWKRLDLYSNLNLEGRGSVMPALQMKGRLESYMNVWFPFMYSQKWNCAASLFLKQNYNVLSPNFYNYISAKDLYISRISLSYFAAAKYVDRFWEDINRSQTHESWKLEWGHTIPRKGIHKWDLFRIDCDEKAAKSISSDTISWAVHDHCELLSIQAVIYSNSTVGAQSIACAQSIGPSLIGDNICEKKLNLWKNFFTEDRKGNSAAHSWTKNHIFSFKSGK